MREEYATLHAEVTAKRRTAVADARREAADLVAGAKARIEAAVREVREAVPMPTASARRTPSCAICKPT
jgi:F0F1-type ATP synthase membrane subunit b/b'